MYYSKIEADRVVDHRTSGTVDVSPNAGTTAFGLFLLFVGLPWLLARVFIWAVARDIRRVFKFGAIIGQTAIQAARGR